ncbi:hypothetical protein [Enterococcus sp. AZ196]|uniref:hypothetical protein n=1 Tax=Enterococcus sp. AZ196 TaxID=2774659 RepID=UPI003D2AC4F3
MKKGVKSRKLFAAVVDLFIYSILVRIFLFSLYQSGGNQQISFLMGLLVGGMLSYVAVPLFLKGQTLGMKMNGLVYSFVNEDTFKNGIILAGRFLSQLFLNIVLLGMPLAINLFLMLWRKDGNTIADRLFASMMVSQKIL